MRTFRGICAFVLFMVLTGCATREWAESGDWRKKTGWEYDPAHDPVSRPNPGVVGGIAESILSFANPR